MSERVQLSQKEYNSLCKAGFLPDRLRQLFFLTEREENAYVVNISEDQANEIRDLCGYRFRSKDEKLSL